MKHIRNLWNLLKQEISLWKYEKQELVKGICYIVMIAWLFFDQIAFVIFLKRTAKARRSFQTSAFFSNG